MGTPYCPVVGFDQSGAAGHVVARGRGGRRSDTGRRRGRRGHGPGLRVGRRRRRRGVRGGAGAPSGSSRRRPGRPWRRSRRRGGPLRTPRRGSGVRVAPGAPEDDVVAVAARCSRRSRAPGRSEVPVNESIRQPSTSKTQHSSSARVGGEFRPAGRIVAGQAIGRHYWYTLFAMQHPWDRRLGFWYLAEEYPDQPAVVACPSGVTLTFAELAGRAHQLVHGLRARGLGAGDIFAYALPNDVDMLCWQLAAQEGGFASIALNPALSGARGPADRGPLRGGGPRPAPRLRRPGRADVGHRVDRAAGLGGRRHPRASRASGAHRRPAHDGAARPGAGLADQLLVGHDGAAEGGDPAALAQRRPLGGRGRRQDLRPRLPVPTADGRAPRSRPACTTAAARGSISVP